MKVCDHMSAEHIFLRELLKDKDAVLRFAARKFAQTGVTQNWAEAHDLMAARENLMSTGIGKGIGIPHAECPSVAKAAVVLVCPQQAVDFKALDNKPVDIIIAMVIPPKSRNLHLRLLARISRLCKNSQFIHAVRSAKNAEELFARIQDIESKMAFH